MCVKQAPFFSSCFSSPWLCSGEALHLETFSFTYWMFRVFLSKKYDTAWEGRQILWSRSSREIRVDRQSPDPGFSVKSRTPPLPARRGRWSAFQGTADLGGQKAHAHQPWDTSLRAAARQEECGGAPGVHHQCVMPALGGACPGRWAPGRGLVAETGEVTSFNDSSGGRYCSYRFSDCKHSSLSLKGSHLPCHPLLFKPQFVCFNCEHTTLFENQHKMANTWQFCFCSTFLPKTLISKQLGQCCTEFYFI